MAGGGGNQSTQAVTTIPRSQWNAFIIRVFSIVMLIFFTLVLFEQYRKLMSTWERMQDARAVYLQYKPGETPEEHNFYDNIKAFFKIMYEIGAGTIISAMNNITPQAIQDVKGIMAEVAQEETAHFWESCYSHMASCGVDLLTGAATASFKERLTDRSSQQIQERIQRGIHNAQTDIKDTIRNWNTSSHNFVISLHGLTFGTILLLHTIFPKRYNQGIVNLSAGTLGISFAAGPLYGLYGLGEHVTLLFYPEFLKKITAQPETGVAEALTDSEPHLDRQIEQRNAYTVADLTNALRRMHFGGNHKKIRDSYLSDPFLRLSQTLGKKKRMIRKRIKTMKKNNKKSMKTRTAIKKTKTNKKR
jgi:hypothetical protein